MSYISGVSRNQIVLFPEAIDDYISQENSVRFIDAFVEKINLSKQGFKKSNPAKTGRPAYDPRALLKLYLYGYKNRITSSRRLEMETHRNMEVIWLLRKLRPDFKTIADFRKENALAFKAIFREFTLLCRSLNLFAAELVAIDGTKIKAVNSSARNYSKKRLEKSLREINQRIDDYLKTIDQVDEQEAGTTTPGVSELQEAINSLEEKKERSQKMIQQMEKTGETQVSLTDPDSRSFPRKFGVRVGYNAQSAVDSKHHLIVEQDVSNAVTDIDQLSAMAIKTKEGLGVDKLTVVADAGYCNATEIQACEDEDIETYVPKTNTSISTKQGRYGKEQFSYDTAYNRYICPVGKHLPYRFEGNEKRRDKIKRVLYYVGESCQSCEQKALCTKSKNPRRITRCPEEGAIDRMQLRMQQHPEIMKKRKAIGEHPFGTIKFWNHQNAFLMRGLEKVRAEFSLSTLAYNMKRVINIVGVKKMIEALD